MTFSYGLHLHPVYLSDLTTVTKGLLGAIVLSSVAFIIPLHNHRYWFTYSYTSVFEKHDVSMKVMLC